MKIPENVNFADYVKIVGDLEAQEIHSAGYWRDRVLSRLDGAKITGDQLPWAKTHNCVRLREGELSIWAGMNGHRKSMLLGQVMGHLANHKNIAIASLEMYPEETLFRMICQSSTSVSPSKDYADLWIDWADKRILIYDQLDKVRGEKILGFIHYCAKELNCKHVVIDSLTKCGIDSDDRNSEKDFIDRLQWAAKTFKIHVHLVCHVRKPQSHGEEYIPNKFDVRGAGELVDLVDNCFITWKDKAKERAVELKKRNLPMDKKELDALHRPDQLLIVAKQRHGAWEGTFDLWFHECMQFTAQENKPVVMELAA